MEGGTETDSTSGSESEDERQSDEQSTARPIDETTYEENEQDISATSGPQAEEFADENKNIIWCLMKQVGLYKNSRILDQVVAKCIDCLLGLHICFASCVVFFALSLSGAAWNGFVQGHSTHIHPRATLSAGEVCRLLLPL